MATLRVLVDPVLSEVPTGVGRYAQELTWQLIQTAPRGCNVEGIVAAHNPRDEKRLRHRLPGLAALHTVSLRRRELSLAWQMGARPSVGDGMIHAPSLLAPLRKHDRANDGTQIVVTVHDVAAWTTPDSLSTTDVLWHKAMLKRARKHADAIVVPTHAVAEQLAEIANFGSRIRVISGAPSASLQLPIDNATRAARLKLPEQYVAAIGDLTPRKGLRALIEAMARPELQGLPLLIAGEDETTHGRISEVAMELGLREGIVRPLGPLSDDDLAVLYDRASVFAYPSTASGFGLPIVEAFRFGTPVVHSDDPSLLEVASGAGLVVPREDQAGYPRRLAQAISAVIEDNKIAERLSVSSSDRARAFSWRDSAERVWQLHADL